MSKQHGSEAKISVVYVGNDSLGQRKSDAGKLLVTSAQEVKGEAMKEPVERGPSDSPTVLSNAEIADRLAGLCPTPVYAKGKSIQGEGLPPGRRAHHATFQKVWMRWYAEKDDLTQFSGIGAAIASAIAEIVRTGTLAARTGKATERGHAGAVAELSAHPRLDPRRVMRVYQEIEDQLPGRVASAH